MNWTNLLFPAQVSPLQFKKPWLKPINKLIFGISVFVKVIWRWVNVLLLGLVYGIFVIPMGLVMRKKLKPQFTLVESTYTDNSSTQCDFRRPF